MDSLSDCPRRTTGARTGTIMNVSIIIPAFNAANTIAETVASVLAQTVADWEAVIVDDGSTDRTGKLADKFARQDARIRVVHQVNGGEAAARNAGLMAARHEWILFLDADDYIAPQYLERMRDAVTANPGLDAVHCGWARIAADGTELIDRYEPPTGDMFDVWAQRSAFPVHACIVRASQIAEVGLFDISLRKSADWDLWQRIARTGAQFGAVREVLAFYRMGASSASLEASLVLEDGLRVLSRGHGPDPRVAHPDPRHVNGRDPALIPSQAFYLMCWCGGLLLGRDEDARPLLRQLAGMRFPGLYPPAVAQCIFDAAPLPACAAPTAWETLWPRVHQRVDAFLLAVEEHAGAADLAAQARLALMRMSLANSSSWRPVVDDDNARHARQEGAIEQQQATIGRQEGTIKQQQATIGQQAGTIKQQQAMIGQQDGTIKQQQATIGQQDGMIKQQQATIGQQDGAIQQRQATIGQHLASIAQLEADRQEAQRLNDERAQALETSAARIMDLEQASALLERDRAEWRRLSEDRAQALERSAALIRELDDFQAQLRNDVSESERLSGERAMLLADLRSRPWAGLGFRLGLLKPSPVMDVADGTSIPGAPGDWQLVLGPGSDAHLMPAPGERESVRVVIASVRKRNRWDIQLNRPGLTAVAQQRYTIHFRARADRPRTIGVGFAQAHAPWAGLGLYRVIRLTPEWTEFHEEFVAAAGDDNCRIHFDVGRNRTAVEVAAVTLGPLSDNLVRDTNGSSLHTAGELREEPPLIPVADLDEKRKTPDETPAGRLKRLVIPRSSPALGSISQAALSGEVLARIEAGAFSGSEEEILIGCELHEALEGALDVHNNRWSARRYRDLFGDFYGSLALPRPTLDGATVVDLGCGGHNPYGVLFLFLMLGAKRGIAG